MPLKKIIKPVRKQRVSLTKNNNAPIDWDDLIAESEVLEKLKIHRITLLRLRSEGALRWTSLKGRHIMYSKKEILELLNK